MIKKTYTTETERNELIISMPAMRVIEDARHLDKNYLLFISPEEVEPYVLEASEPGPSELDILREQLQSTQAAVDFLLLSQIPLI